MSRRSDSGDLWIDGYEEGVRDGKAGLAPKLRRAQDELQRLHAVEKRLEEAEASLVESARLLGEQSDEVSRLRALVASRQPAPYPQHDTFRQTREETHTMMEQVLMEVRAERLRQDEKWGSQRALHPRTWLTILVEEVGEVANASLERDHANYREELVQVAAVAVAAVESYDHQLAAAGAAMEAAHA